VWENLRCAVLWATGHRYAFWKNIDNLPEVRDRTAQILADINLTARRDVSAGLLTYAEQRALEIGITIAGGADVILLDEPFTGLDAVGSAALGDTLAELKNAAVGLILVTHHLQEGLAVATHVAVMRSGRFVRYESREAIEGDAYAEGYLELAAAAQ